VVGMAVVGAAVVGTAEVGAADEPAPCVHDECSWATLTPRTA